MGSAIFHPRPARTTTLALDTRRSLPALFRALALALGNDPAAHDDPSASSLGPHAATPGPAGGAGPRTALDAIYREHARTVLVYLYHRLPTTADAEDALSEVFTAALAACASGTTPGIGWLIVAARRRVADYYRRRERGPSVTTLEDDAALARPAAATGDPEVAALRAEERRELLALVARLPAEQREVLALRFAAGLPSAEIAAIIGKTDQATRAILSRALRRLRQEWGR